MVEFNTSATGMVQMSNAIATVRASTAGTVQLAPGQRVQTVAPVRVPHHGENPSWRELRFLVVRSTTNTVRLSSPIGVMHGELLRPMPDENFRATEMAWLEEHREELAQRYPGECIAIDGSELVAHAPDLVSLLERARAAGHSHPLITAVPATSAPLDLVG